MESIIIRDNCRISSSSSSGRYSGSGRYKKNLVEECNINNKEQLRQREGYCIKHKYMNVMC